MSKQETELLELLENAYIETVLKVQRGLLKFPRSMETCWEKLQKGYDTLQRGKLLKDIYDVYIVAAKEYDRGRMIGIDEAFASIVCEMGIKFRSSEWYRIMAYHYICQAEWLEKKYEIGYKIEEVEEWV